LARSVGKNILQSSASVVGRGARDTSSRRYHAADRVPSLDGFETVTRGGLATRRVMARARRGPRFPRCPVPDTTQTEKKWEFFRPRNGNPALVGQSQRDCWQVSTLPRDIFYVFEVRDRNETSAFDHVFDRREREKAGFLKGAPCAAKANESEDLFMLIGMCQE
jgi:hypothetical protein